MTAKRLDRLVFTTLVMLFLVGCLYAYSRIPEGQPFWTWFGIFIGAGLTLAIYSFLYRDNPVFKMAENLYVGVGAGYGIWLTVRLVLIPDLWEPLGRPLWLSFRDGVLLWVWQLVALDDLTGLGAQAVQHPWDPLTDAKWLLLVPTVLGLLMWGRFHPKTEALSRISFAFIVGMGAGMSIPVTVSAILLKQTYATVNVPALFFRPEAAAPLSFMTWVNAVLILIGTLCVLAYFFFSMEHRGPLGVASRMGVFFLMVSFGSAFGYTVMARVSLLIGRFQFLLHQWLHLTP